jgi:hypothetical protein
VKENKWKSISGLVNKGKNLNLCKFSKDNGRKLNIYCFGKNFIERLDLMKSDALWEDIKIKYKEYMPLNANCL